MNRSYLDHNATSPMRPEVLTTMTKALQTGGNASSVHHEGRRARAMLEHARQQVAALVGGDPAGLVFTSGGTEACHLALQTRKAPAGETTRILVSAGEHAAVLAAADIQGLAVETLPLLGNGQIDLAALDVALENPAPALVAVMAANNETGVIQPVRDIGEKVKSHGSLFFCDAVQAAGKIPLNMARAGIDLLSLSGHKLSGPSGVGALLAGPSVALMPVLHGGGQELRRRAGTENLAGIAGFGQAAELAATHIAAYETLAEMRDDMEIAMQQAAPEMEVFGADAPRLPNTSCFSAAGLKAETLVMALDLAGISVSAGSACSSGKVTRSHVLEAMGVQSSLSDGAIRVSLGWDSTPQDTRKLADVWLQQVSRLHRSEAQLTTAGSAAE